MRQRGHSSRHALEHGRISARDVFGLHTEANLVEPCLRELSQARIIEQIAARIQAHVSGGIQLARPLDEGHDLLLVQQRLATRDSKAVELSARIVCGVELGHDIAAVGKEILVVILVGIEAEVAMARATQVNEKCCRALAGAARQARRRYPPAPQGAAPVLAMAAASAGHLCATLSGTGFRSLEGNAESGDRFLIIAFYLVKCFRVFPNIHRYPYSPICPISQSSCALSTWATMTMPWANAAYDPRASRSITF